MTPILANMANPTTWIVIAIVVLVLFGGAKIPELMKGLGQGTREFKKGLNEEDDDELRRERENQKLRDEIAQEERAKVRAEIEREAGARLNKS